jgi:hypothetical protein
LSGCINEGKRRSEQIDVIIKSLSRQGYARGKYLRDSRIRSCMRRYERKMSRNDIEKRNYVPEGRSIFKAIVVTSKRVIQKPLSAPRSRASDDDRTDDAAGAFEPHKMMASRIALNTLRASGM